MKKCLLLSFCIIPILSLYSQSTYIQWQKSLGGSNDDGGHSIIATVDGGYAIAGRSLSNDGNVTGNHGGNDYWVVKIDSVGTIQWQKSFGGSGDDITYSIIQTTDGGYTVAGYSSSTDGNVTGNHGNYDYWVVKLSSAGVIQWQKSLGGSGMDQAFSIIQTIDGSFIIAGLSYSINGDVTGHHGTNTTSDYWIVKLNSNGFILWQKSLGGSSNDVALSIIQTVDSGFAIAGMSYSNDGDVTGNHNGSADYWIVKLNAIGTIQWQKAFGGSGTDYAYSIIQTSDSGYAVAGYSDSNDGDVSGNHGNSDYWVLKLNSSGTTQWQKSLGGGFNDIARSIIQTHDNRFTIAGYSQSSNGDVLGHHGANTYDYWIVGLDSSGNIEWQKSLGSNDNDNAMSVIQTSDSAYAIAGTSRSNGGDVSGNHGGVDYWIVKLGLCALTPPVITAGGATAICMGDSVLLTSSFLDNNHWSQGDTVQSIFVYSAGIYADTLRDHSGCTAVSNAISISVNANPTVNISTTTTAICNGGNANLSASGGGVYSWSNSLGNNAQVTASPNATTTYSVTITNANNCSASDSIIVRVNPNPTASISPDTVIICEGNNTTLMATGGDTYAWSNSLGNNAQVTVSPNTTTTYSVTVTDVNLCSATVSKMVTVNPTPTVPVITASGNTLQSSNAINYQWYFNNVPITGATSQTYIAPQSGNYFVVITDINGCEATSNQTTVLVNIIDYLTQNEQVILYPNPASNRLFVETNGKTITEIKIYNAIGSLVSLTQQPSNNIIDISTLPIGVYVAEVIIKEAYFRKRWIKM